MALAVCAELLDIQLAPSLGSLAQTTLELVYAGSTPILMAVSVMKSYALLLCNSLCVIMRAVQLTIEDSSNMARTKASSGGFSRNVGVFQPTAVAVYQTSTLLGHKTDAGARVRSGFQSRQAIPPALYRW